MRLSTYAASGLSWFEGIQDKNYHPDAARDDDAQRAFSATLQPGIAWMLSGRGMFSASQVSSFACMFIQIETPVPVDSESLLSE